MTPLQAVIFCSKLSCSAKKSPPDVYKRQPNGCTYCYATTRPALLRRARAVHAPDAPMLTGWPRGGEQITDRTGPSPVSYTHLKECGGRCVTVLERLDRVGKKPVSYTHLDVYKRQGG